MTHLLTPRWREENKKSGVTSTGFCYIATEALFHLIGGKSSGYYPMVVSYGLVGNGSPSGTHWWLQNAKGEILDPTADQFPVPPPYHLGRRCGFLTGYKKPSKNAQVLIREME